MYMLSTTYRYCSCLGSLFLRRAERKKAKVWSWCKSMRERSSSRQGARMEQVFIGMLKFSITDLNSTTIPYRLQRIAIHFQRARQFMRLGKFVLEYYEGVELVHRQTRDEFGRLISIILHAIFSFYWALDNISLAASFDILNVPEFEVSQSAMTIKFFGMALTTLLNLST